MEISLPIEFVRREVLKALVDLGRSHATWALVRETELFSDPTHAGRRFQYDGIRAVWYGDSRLIEVFSEDGHPLKSIDLGEPVASKRAA